MILVLGIVAIVTFGWWLQHLLQLWGGTECQLPSVSDPSTGDPTCRPTPYSWANEEDLYRDLAMRVEEGAT